MANGKGSVSSTAIISICPQTQRIPLKCTQKLCLITLRDNSQKRVKTVNKPKLLYHQPLSGLWVKNAKHFPGEQVHGLTCQPGIPVWSVSCKLFKKGLSRSTILESHIKVITQLEKSIGTNYSKSLQMEIHSSTVGGRKCEPSTKDWLKSLRQA